ncbi:MAG TPA: site-specific DNA-methyltransferase [Pyrinomonadaceae bacterium]|jgi:site-specific DNA-methyltransferase (adenine-specific)
MNHQSSISKESNRILVGDCKEVLSHFPEEYFSACVTDPPYNYEFIGRSWDESEIQRRLDRIQDSNTLVKNIPYGSGLAGGVRNNRWYKRNRENILEYQEWCLGWGKELYRTVRSGAYVLVFNSTRTVAHVQVALEEAGFYARDILVWRRHSGIPKGLNFASKLEKLGEEDGKSWEGWHSCLRNEWEAICMLQKPLINNYMETIKSTGVGLLHAQMNGSGFLSNIIEGMNNKNGDDKVDGHCTVKPLELIRFLLRLVVPENKRHIVLDPFAGTGTTCLAAKQLGHDYIGVEISEKYCQIATDRLKRNEENLQSSLF